MLKILIASFLFFSFGLSAQKVTETIYFFKNLEIKDSTQLLLVTHRAQTNTAHLLGNRLYSDTSYIRKLKENSYKEIIDGEYEAHFCGYDMYFYGVYGNEVQFLNAANSQCGLNDLGCETLDTMLFLGAPLHFDTLDIGTSFWSSNYDSILENSILTTSHDIVIWDLARNKKYPRFYYDYSFEVILENDSEKSEREIIETYLATITDNLNGVNWHYRYQDSINRIFEGPEIRFQCYLKDFRKADFEQMNLKPVNKQFDPQNNYLLLKPEN